jgi:hypothetical protein
VNPLFRAGCAFLAAIVLVNLAYLATIGAPVNLGIWGYVLLAASALLLLKGIADWPSRSRRLRIRKSIPVSVARGPNGSD